MKGPGILEQISNTTRATINIAFWAIVAFMFLLSALTEYPRATVTVTGICVVVIATLYGRRLVARRRLDTPLSTSEPADLPRRSNAQIQGKPPLLPVLVGVSAVGFGLVNGLFFTVWAANVLIGRPDPAPPAASLVPGLLVLMDVFTLLQIPAGVGMLLHRPWGKKLASATALGTVITGLLGSGLGALAVTGFPDVVMATFVWGFATGLAWAIALGVASRYGSGKTAFVEDESQGAPPASDGWSTRWSDPGELPMKPDPAAPHGPRATSRLLLRVRDEDGRHEEFYLASGLTIGPGRENTVVLPEAEPVAPTYARIDVGEGGALLRCAGPVGSVTAAGVAVRELPIDEGVRFTIGRTEFVCVDGLRADGQASPRTHIKSLRDRVEAARGTYARAEHGANSAVGRWAIRGTLILGALGLAIGVPIGLVVAIASGDWGVLGTTLRMIGVVAVLGLIFGGLAGGVWGAITGGSDQEPPASPGEIQDSIPSESPSGGKDRHGVGQGSGG